MIGFKKSWLIEGHDGLKELYQQHVLFVFKQYFNVLFFWVFLA